MDEVKEEINYMNKYNEKNIIKLREYDYKNVIFFFLNCIEKRFLLSLIKERDKLIMLLFCSKKY